MKTDEAIVKLFKIIESLRKMYPHKRFTLDGRLVGDLGEVIAEENYNLILFDKVVEKYDGKALDGRLVQIKATFHDSLGFPCDENHVPEIYLGIKIAEDGSFEEIYNGAGSRIWEKVRTLKVPKNNIYNISLNKLRELDKKVKQSERVEGKR